MSATDELRRILDERGVKWWWEAWNKDLTIFDGAHGVRYRADHTLGEWFIRSVLPITAEQAIAATLGGGECELTDNGPWGYPYVCSACGASFDPDVNGGEFNYCPNCGAKVVKR